MSIRLSPRLRQALQHNPWSLPRNLLSQLPRTEGFVSFEDRGHRGVLLIDPEMDPPIRIVSRSAPRVDETYVVEQLGEAIAFRQSLAAQEQLDTGPHAAYRLINETGDGLPGLAIDVYAGFALLHLYSQAWESWLACIARTLLGAKVVRGIYLTERKRGARVHTTRFVEGERADNEEVIVVEHGIRYLIRLAEGPATGLYLDQRENRRHVAGLAGGGVLLNTFAYTCSFSLTAAMLGGGATFSVDLSKASLQRGRENFALNGLSPDAHRFLADDVFAVLPRLHRRGERFQSVLLDPPTFARVKKRTFSTERNYGDLVRLAAPLVEPGGHLIAFANTHRMSDDAWMEQVYAGLDHRREEFFPLQRPGQAPDFRFHPDDPGGHYLKGLILRARG